jgi:hypothetical protein
VTTFLAWFGGIVAVVAVVGVVFVLIVQDMGRNGDLP